MDPARRLGKPGRRHAPLGARRLSPRDLGALTRGLASLTRAMKLDVARAPLMFERD